MGPFGLIAVIMICMTVLIVSYWLFTRTITIKHIAATDPKKLEAVSIPVEMSEAERKKLEEELNKGAIAQRAMDEVIKSVNEMMGIASTDDEGGNN